MTDLIPALRTPDVHILQMLREGISYERVVAVGRYRRAWTDADVQRAVAREREVHAALAPPPPDRHCAIWRPPGHEETRTDVVLSNREAEVLTLLCQCVITTREIATRLGVSESSAFTFLKRLYDAIGAHNQCEAVALALTGAVRIHVKPPRAKRAA